MRRPHAAVFGKPTFAQTTQDIALVICGGGDPLAEYRAARELIGDKPFATFAGNDMIGDFPDHLDHACTLHPVKLPGWLYERERNGFEKSGRVWAYRFHQNGLVTDSIADWGGSTGLFCTKVARTLGYVHVILCGVPMSKEIEHYRRKGQDWHAALAFRRGWNTYLNQLKPHIRSMSGWTREQFGAPTQPWIDEELKDYNHLPLPGVGLTA